MCYAVIHLFREAVDYSTVVNRSDLEDECKKFGEFKKIMIFDVGLITELRCRNL